MPRRGRVAGDDPVLPRYVDGLGVERSAPVETRQALDRAVFSEDPDSPPLVIDAGSRRLTLDPQRSNAAWKLRLEDAREIDVRLVRRGRGVVGQTAEPIPIGVHRLLSTRNDSVHVLARPRSLASQVTSASRRMALFLPLYSIRPGGPFGIGTYRDLRDLCTWAEGFGEALVGTLPLFPAFLDSPHDPSPYMPVSRLMWNELFVDPTLAPEWKEPSVRRSVQSGSRPGAGDLVDYRRSWKTARRTLKAMAGVARAKPGRWAEVLSRCDGETHTYAAFRAAVDASGTTWQSWSQRVRDNPHTMPGLDAADIDLYVYAQALAREQIALIHNSRRGASPLYLDLPVGVHGGGFDTYMRPDLFIAGFSAGAPPDALNSRGQTWGFPPMHPTAGRADGYLYLRSVLRRLMSVAGVLRIDHVMGLYRMFCIPDGQDGTHGAYLRYPEEELFAVVMIEVANAGAVIVGEDLGTVPVPVRTIMRRRGILGMHVQQFAFDGPPPRVISPAGSHTLASLNTHDTPTFAGFWHGDDVSLRYKLGFTTRPEMQHETTARARTRRAIKKDLRGRRLPASSARAAALSIMKVQAHGRAPITLVNLEDLLGERRPQNVPGTSGSQPNWRRTASRTKRRILSDPALAKTLKALSLDRKGAAS